jgi:undecaprenyl diphosphate synthase
MATKAKSGEPRLAPDHGARHVAIIMDGNGRWAKKRFLPRIAGHRAGVEAVRRVARAALDQGLECLTIYAFSSENWKRPAEEVSDLMGLLRRFIETDVNELHENGIRLKIIGNYKALSPVLVEMIEDSVVRTANNSAATLAIALNYGAQDEILRAVQSLGAQVAAGELAPGDIDAARIDAEMYTAGLPPLDLLIRTSGEQRLSNFLLWQAAYAELYFTDTLWPDFNEDALVHALDSFKQRDRRFGGL